MSQIFLELMLPFQSCPSQLGDKEIGTGSLSEVSYQVSHSIYALNFVGVLECEDGNGVNDHPLSLNLFYAHPDRFEQLDQLELLHSELDDPNFFRGRRPNWRDIYEGELSLSLKLA